MKIVSNDKITKVFGQMCRYSLLIKGPKMVEKKDPFKHWKGPDTWEDDCIEEPDEEDTCETEQR